MVGFGLENLELFEEGVLVEFEVCKLFHLVFPRCCKMGNKIGLCFFNSREFGNDDAGVAVAFLQVFCHLVLKVSEDIQEEGDGRRGIGRL